MTVKYQRQNTNFQIAHFIAGKHHTPDAAYFELKNLQKDRQGALQREESTRLRFKSRRIKLEQQIKSQDESERLIAEADLIDLSNEEQEYYDLVESSKAELNFINECIEKIQPLRKYSHLSDIEAAEACQAEEWGFELQRRAENFMLTSGTIPSDHFNTMRLHPDFETKLLPHIEDIHQALQQPGGSAKLLALTKRDDTIPKLLGLTKTDE